MVLYTGRVRIVSDFQEDGARAEDHGALRRGAVPRGAASVDSEQRRALPDTV